MQGVEIPEEAKRPALASAPISGPASAVAAEINRPPSRTRRGPGQLQL